MPFPLSEYRLGACMQVGDSLFSRDGMDLQVSTPEVELEGHLRYAGLTPLRSDIMGPFAFLPLATKHTVFLSLIHISNREAVDNAMQGKEEDEETFNNWEILSLIHI